MRPRISITGYVRWSVNPFVRWSVRPSVGDAFVKNKENHYFCPKNCRRRYTRQISCNHIIIQSFNHHEDASLALWALLTSSWGRKCAKGLFMAHNTRFHNFSTDSGKKWIFLIDSDWSYNSFFRFWSIFCIWGAFWGPFQGLQSAYGTQMKLRPQ